MYGPLPETSDHIALPFIYPPFAAMVLLPLAVAPWAAGLVRAARAVHGRAGAHVLRGGPAAVALRRARGALSVASIALPLALAVQPGKAIDFSRPAPPIPAFALEPVMQTIEFGQVNLLLMALVAVDVLVARTALAARPAGRDRRGDQADPGGVRPLLPAAPGLPRRRCRRGRPPRWPPASRSSSRRARRWTFWLDNPAGGVSGSPFFTNQTIQAGAGAGGGRRLAEGGAVARAVGRACSRWPPRRSGARPPPLALMATAGVALLVSPDVVVAPLGVGRAGPARRGRVGVARPFVQLARGHGRCRRRCSSSRRTSWTCRTTARAGRSASRSSAARTSGSRCSCSSCCGGGGVRHADLVAYCLAKPGAVRRHARGRRTSSRRSAARSSRSSAAAASA